MVALQSNTPTADGPPTPAVTPAPAPHTRAFQSLSIVIPTFNEAESMRPLYDELCRELPRTGVPFEIVWIDDGSSDGTPAIARKLAAEDPRVKYVRFRRNFGKAAALSEGFKRATGDIVVTMDGDLQDDPAQVELLLAKIDGGADLVSGWKWPRQDPLGKRLPSKLFNLAIRWGTGLQLHDTNCGLKAYRRQMMDSITVYGDLHRYIPVLAHANGYRVEEVKVSHRPRQFGRSKYSLGRFSRGFLDFLTVLFLTRYRNRPLHLIGGLAIGMGFLGVAVLTWLTILWFGGQPIAGRPLFFLGILMLIVSVQLFTFGLLAEMVTSFFVQRRNEYSVIEAVGFEQQHETQTRTD